MGAEERDVVAWGATWSESERRERQRRLGTSTHDERLHQREIVFIERFIASGHELEWIARDTKRYRPTNDFRWLSNCGLEFELKSNKARFETITAATFQAIYKGNRQGVAKENFMINLGYADLEVSLRRRLSLINLGRQDRILELWVMSATGLEQIPLET